MASAEFYAMSMLYRLAPDMIAEPIAWGTYEEYEGKPGSSRTGTMSQNSPSTLPSHSFSSSRALHLRSGPRYLIRLASISLLGNLHHQHSCIPWPVHRRQELPSPAPLESDAECWRPCRPLIGLRRCCRRYGTFRKRAVSRPDVDSHNIGPCMGPVIRGGACIRRSEVVLPRTPYLWDLRHLTHRTVPA